MKTLYLKEDDVERLVSVPEVIDVLDTESWRRIETMPTERGAHTLAFDARHDTIYAFLPESHRAAVYQDS